MRRIAVLGLLGMLMILAVAGHGQTTETAARLYQLPAGTRLDFESSASIHVTGATTETQSVQVVTSYTLLMEKAGVRTVFAAADLVHSEQNGNKGKSGDTARYTFEVNEEGAAQGRPGGMFRQLIPGWLPGSDFPTIAAEGESTVTRMLPLVNAPVDMRVKVVKSGDTIRMDVGYVASPADIEQGIPVRRYDVEYIYSAKDNALVSSAEKLEAIQTDRMDQEVRLVMTSRSERRSARRLPAAELEQLSKDVAAGIPAFEQYRQSMSMGPDAPKDAHAVLDKYLAQFPNGVFAGLYNRMLKESQLMSKVQANMANLKEGSKAPAFEAKTIDGEKVRLEDYKGKIVLLDFWATWCGPCIMQMTSLKELYEKNKDRGFVTIGISADHELETLRSFVKERGVPWKQIFEPELKDGNVGMIYGVAKYPTTVLIDREGTIKAIDAHGEGLDELVENLLKEQKK